MDNFQDHGVTGTWVKYYDTYGMCWEDHGQPTVDSARRKYQRLVKDPSVTFAQWGAQTVDGPITLGEYRP